MVFSSLEFLRAVREYSARIFFPSVLLSRYVCIFRWCYCICFYVVDLFYFIFFQSNATGRFFFVESTDFCYVYEMFLLYISVCNMISLIYILNFVSV